MVSGFVAISVGGETRYWATDAATPLSLEAPPSDSVLVEVAAFTEPLTSHEVAPGELEALATGRQVLKLRGLERTYSASFDAGDDPPAFRSTAPDSLTLLSALRLPPLAGPCQPIVAETHEAPSGADARLSMSVGEGRVLVSFEDGVLVLVTADEVRSLGKAPHDSPLTDGFALDGEIWAANMDGEIWRGRLQEQSFSADLVTTTSAAQPISDLSGGHGALGVELAALSMFGRAEWFDGQSWVQIHDFGVVERDSEKGSALWLGPGEVLFASGFSSELVRATDREIRTETPSGVGITRVLALPNGRFFAADAEGGLYSKLPEMGWVDLLSPYKLPSHVLVPIEPEGVVFGGPFGSLSRWFESSGFCEPERPVAFDVGEIVPLGDDYVLSGGLAARERASVGIVDSF